MVCVLLLALVSTVFVSNAPPVNGAGPTLALSTVPSRIQEGASGGIRLVLNVTNASITVYTINWSVTNPFGSSTTASNTTTSTGSTWSVSTKYPAAFGASTNLVGVYNVTVTVTPLAGTPSTTTGNFQVGLTDNTSYQRTVPVLINASGYLPLDNITINLTQGSASAPNFPTSRKADTNGLVSLTWQTTVGTTLGSYLLAMSGTTTPTKNIPDSQTFIIYPTNATISGLWLSKSSIERTEALEFRFNATYLNGSPVSSGSATIHVTEPNGTMQATTASYDSLLKTFRAFYSTVLGSSTGTWTGAIASNNFDDGLGNGGPLTPVSTNFNVQPASLLVSRLTYNVTYSSGTIIPIYARVTTPSTTSFTTGTVTATITSFGQKITGPLSLVYDGSRAEWSGSYKVNATDPSGTWVMTVTASDGYGNTGQNSTSLFVNTPGRPGPQNPSGMFDFLSSWTFWLLVLVIVATGFGILILRSRGASHREVKLDVQAIKHQADQVKSDDFLQSIQAQLKRRAEKNAAEKEKHD